MNMSMSMLNEVVAGQMSMLNEVVAGRFDRVHVYSFYMVRIESFDDYVK